MRKQIQTLQDIARLANVSTSTVSRALNDSPLLNAETKARIRAIARQHNFRANAPARNLRLRQSRTIAFLASDPTGQPSDDGFFGQELLRGMGRGLGELGYDLLIAHASPDDPAWAQAYLGSGRADGLILVASGVKPGLIAGLVESGVPFITWGAPLAGLRYCSVAGDNFNGGRIATTHLTGLGRRRIAFIGGPQATQTAQERYQGYASALQAAGVALDERLVCYGDYSYASGAAAMRRMLAQTRAVDAVFASSDLMAIAAIQVIQEGGGHVPDAVAVIGYDDLPIAQYNNLPLTTIRQDLRLAGRLLAQNLIQYLQTGAITNVTLPAELVIRKSA